MRHLFNTGLFSLNEVFQTHIHEKSQLNYASIENVVIIGFFPPLELLRTSASWRLTLSFLYGCHFVGPFFRRKSKQTLTDVYFILILFS